MQLGPFYFDIQIRAVVRFQVVRGGGAVSDPKIVFEPQSGDENCFDLLGACSPGKFLK